MSKRSFKISTIASLLPLISYLNFVIGQGLESEFSFRDALTGKTCSGVVFTMGYLSAVQCAVMCHQHTNCKSLFYDRGAMTCTGCDVIYVDGDVTIWPDESGTEYFGPYAHYGQNCSDSGRPCIDSNTVCFSGLDVCVCDPQTFYDPGSGTCVDDCKTLGDTYQMYPEWVMTGHDAVLKTQMFQYDVTPCLLSCHNDDFTPDTCYAVEYDFVGSICYYNIDKVAADPPAWGPWIIFKTYIRNCA